VGGTSHPLQGGVVDLTGGRSPTLPFLHPRIIAKLLVCRGGYCPMNAPALPSW
jgi:hypothetical protein